MQSVSPALKLSVAKLLEITIQSSRLHLFRFMILKYYHPLFRAIQFTGIHQNRCARSMGLDLERHTFRPPACGVEQMLFLKADTDEGLAPKASRILCMGELGLYPSSTDQEKEQGKSSVYCVKATVSTSEETVGHVYLTPSKRSKRGSF